MIESGERRIKSINRNINYNTKEKNKDKIKQYVERHKTHTITEGEWESCLKYFDYSCAYCGMLQNQAKEIYNNYLHKEHVTHKGTDDLSNCVPACKSCNSKKWVYSLDKWYNINNLVYNANRYIRIINWLREDYKKYIECE